MKFKKILIFGCTIAALLASCGKDNQDIQFSGIIESPNSKVALDTANGTLTWERGDQVWITGYSKNPMGGKFIISGLDQNRAYFTKDNTNHGFSDNSNFITIYPLAALVQKDNWINYTDIRPYFKATLPTEQNPNERGYDPRTLVMTSQSTKDDDNQVIFHYHNAVAYLCFTIASSANTNVAYVEVTSEKYSSIQNANYGRLAGIAPVYAINGNSDLYSWEGDHDTEANHKITFRNSDGTPLSPGKNYYVAIWPGNWISGQSTVMNNQKTDLTITAFDSNHQPVGKSLTASGAHQFFRNTIYSVGEIGGTTTPQK